MGSFLGRAVYMDAHSRSRDTSEALWSLAPRTHYLGATWIWVLVCCGSEGAPAKISSTNVHEDGVVMYPHDDGLSSEVGPRRDARCRGTDDCPPPPEDGEDSWQPLGATPTGPKSITISWEAGEPDVERRELRRTFHYTSDCQNPPQETTEQTVSIMDGPSALSHEDTDVLPQSYYCYQLHSWASGRHTVLGPECTETPPSRPPEGLFHVGLTETTLTIAWRDQALTTAHTIDFEGLPHTGLFSSTRTDRTPTCRVYSM